MEQYCKRSARFRWMLWVKIINLGHCMTFTKATVKVLLYLWCDHWMMWFAVVWWWWWWWPCLPCRLKQLWCTTPSTWWPPPRSAPLRSPSAPSSATGTNPGASDHASWACSKTWVCFLNASHPFIHPFHRPPPLCRLLLCKCRGVRRLDLVSEQQWLY